MALVLDQNKTVVRPILDKLQKKKMPNLQPLNKIEKKKSVLRNVLDGFKTYGKKFYGKPDFGGKTPEEYGKMLGKEARRRAIEGGGWPKSKVPDNIW